MGINTEGLGDWKGVSVFAIDPGETTGWAWACIGRRELAQHGAEGALELAARHKSGVSLGDTRFRTGQVGCNYSGLSSAGVGGFVLAELEASNTLLIEMLVCGKMASRTSKGAVRGITSLVAEDFILREKTKARNLLSPVRLTRGLEALVWHEPELNPLLSLERSSDSKGVVTDERLKRWGFWQRGQRHARDAIRVLILHLRKLEA